MKSAEGIAVAAAAEGGVVAAAAAEEGGVAAGGGGVAAEAAEGGVAVVAADPAPDMSCISSVTDSVFSPILIRRYIKMGNCHPRSIPLKSERSRDAATLYGKRLSRKHVLMDAEEIQDSDTSRQSPWEPNQEIKSIPFSDPVIQHVIKRCGI